MTEKMRQGSVLADRGDDTKTMLKIVTMVKVSYGSCHIGGTKSRCSERKSGRKRENRPEPTEKHRRMSSGNPNDDDDDDDSDVEEEDDGDADIDDEDDNDGDMDNYGCSRPWGKEKDSLKQFL